MFIYCKKNSEKLIRSSIRTGVRRRTKQDLGFGDGDFTDNSRAVSFNSFLLRKLQSLEHRCYFINEYFTSQKCPCCHGQTTFAGKGNLRVKYCSSCDKYVHRDLMAAHNMGVLLMAKLRLSPIVKSLRKTPNLHLEQKRTIATVTTASIFINKMVLGENHYNSKIISLPPASKLEQSLVFHLVGKLSKLFLLFGTSFKIYHQSHLTDALSSKRPVITYSNHDTTIDDPVLFGMMPRPWISKPELLRWTLGAQEICFEEKPSLIQKFFVAGRVIPIVRGDGIHQPGMDIALEKLDANEWVHIFPEGRCNPTPEASLLPFRWGIARLIIESKTPPLVVPFYHRGLAQVMPLKTWRKGPRLGKQVDVLFGEAIDTAIWRNETQFYKDEASKRIEITRRLHEKLTALKTDVEDKLTSSSSLSR